MTGRSRCLPLGVLVATAIAMAGCTGGSYPVVVNPITSPAAGPASASTALVGVNGLVVAPAGIVATGGGNIVATGRGNIVATGGGNIVATGGGNFTTQTVQGVLEAPLAGAQVYLADASGAPLPNTPRATTAADGSFKLDRVPAGFTFVVAVAARDAQGRPVTLLTIAHTGDAGATANVSLASTCVATALLDGHTSLGDIDPAAFDAARAALAARLDAGPAPNPADRTGLLAWVKTEEDQLAALHDELGRLRDEIGKPPANPADPTSFFERVVTPASTPAPAASPSASPAAGGDAVPRQHPPMPSTPPGTLPTDPVAGVLLDASGNPIAGAKLLFLPRGNHHEVYPPIETDAQGAFSVALMFGTFPDSYDVKLADGTYVGIWSLGDGGTGFPHSSFAPADSPYHIQVWY